MGVAEMLDRLGSLEIAEWICELSFRDEKEQEALKAPAGPPRTFQG